MGSSSVVVVSFALIAVIAVVLAIPAVHVSDDDSDETQRTRMDCYSGGPGASLLCRDVEDDDDDVRPVEITFKQRLQREKDCKPYQDYIKELFICKNRTLTN
ncbi:uncharacterized protein LOC127002051 [Eriocheir sinensis]|uniref:uncharacterized protein LOC126994486 n=1 Tax=Eriocheir sinensis TaxID=95602 RepID=UPI0021C62177|nr:uncharacterized protein LOC126994486 [Eriocheir sinensis]XP_050723374.1 uncharacterized protein LOC127002051 [Eriocheir sinensis]